jgi:hypothetical protein
MTIHMKNRYDIIEKHYASILILCINICIITFITYKKKSHCRHAGAKGERRYSSTHSYLSALDGVNAQRHAPADLSYPRERKPVPTGQDEGWAAELF